MDSEKNTPRDQLIGHFGDGPNETLCPRERRREIARLVIDPSVLTPGEDRGRPTAPSDRDLHLPKPDFVVESFDVIETDSQSDAHQTTYQRRRIDVEPEKHYTGMTLNRIVPMAPYCITYWHCDPETFYEFLKKQVRHLEVVVDDFHPGLGDYGISIRDASTQNWLVSLVKLEKAPQDRLVSYVNTLLMQSLNVYMYTHDPVFYEAVVLNWNALDILDPETFHNLAERWDLAQAPVCVTDLTMAQSDGDPGDVYRGLLVDTQSYVGTLSGTMIFNGSQPVTANNLTARFSMIQQDWFKEMRSELYSRLQKRIAEKVQTQYQAELLFSDLTLNIDDFFLDLEREITQHTCGG